MTETSILAEALPESIDQLLGKDPLTLTDGEVDRIVVELRKKRNEWLTAEEAKKNKTRKPKNNTPVNLDELNFDLLDITI